MDEEAPTSDQNPKKSRSMKDKQLLELIREYRTTFFGEFSTKLTYKNKTNAWMKVTDRAKSLGLLHSSIDYKYLRDVYGQNLRRRTMKKIDESHKTGAPGGTEMMLDDTDNLVIDIIGKNVSYSSYNKHFILNFLFQAKIPMS